MKKILTIIIAILLATYLSFGANFVLAATTTYVDSVASFTQGLKKDGTAITDPARTDPTKALGIPDGVFVSLGYAGEIVLSFPTYVGGTLTITVTEITFGQYPKEQAEVYVSQNGTDWTDIGMADNTLALGEQNSHNTVFNLTDCVKYIKLIDKTDAALHDNLSDGFDLDAIQADYTEDCTPTVPTSEECNIRITNNNEAVVTNLIETRANTGGNVADGSYAGNGGAGGAIVNNGTEVENSNTGAGGVGGNASEGGTIVTGNATAISSVTNYVNLNRTLVDRCACQGRANCECSNDKVRNNNSAMLFNGVLTDANSGVNVADGSYAGNGGAGGAIVNDEGKESTEVDNSNTGTGGAGGSGSAGGLVNTGAAQAETTVVNVVNRNLTRILR